MKNTIIKSTILILFLIKANAQVSSYTFQNEGHPFPYLAANQSATVRVHDVVDDYVEPTDVNLPFTFRFGGTAYTSVSISENGFIWFGTATLPEVTQWLPMTNQQPPSLTGIISALGVDLHPQDTGSDATKIRSGYFGTSPNRTFVVEWYHTSRITVLNETEGPDEMDFQIRLYEGTNKVEIAYGRFKMNPLFFESVQVGLKTTDTDFNLRSTANAQWGATVSGTTLNSACYLSNTFKPAPGQFMVWTPQSLSVDDQQLNNAVVYPIPAKSSLNISGIETMILHYKVIDLTGRIISKGTVQDYSIPLEYIQPGTFLLELQSDDSVSYHKFIKV